MMDLSKLKDASKLPSSIIARTLYWLVMIVAGLILALAAFGLVTSALPIMCNNDNSAENFDKNLLRMGVSLGVGFVGALVAMLAWAIARVLFRPGDWLVLLTVGMGKPDGLRNPIFLAAKQLVRQPIESAPAPLLWGMMVSHEMLGKAGGNSADEHFEKAIQAARRFEEMAGKAKGIDEFVGQCLTRLRRFDEAIDLFAGLWKSDPTNPDYAAGAAAALEGAGKTDDALTVWTGLANMPKASEQQKAEAKNRSEQLTHRRQWERQTPQSDEVAEMNAATVVDFIRTVPGKALSLLMDLPKKKPEMRQALKGLDPKQLEAVLRDFPGDPDPRWRLVHDVLSGQVKASTIAFIIMGIISVGLAVAVAQGIRAEIQDLIILGGCGAVLALMGAFGTEISAHGSRGKYNRVFGSDRSTGWRGPLKAATILHPLALVGSLVMILLAYTAYQKAHPNYPGRFDRWGLSFTYPADFEEHPQDRVDQRRGTLKVQLRGEGQGVGNMAGPRKTSNSTDFSTGDKSANVRTSIIVFDRPPSADVFWSERQAVLKQAKHRGDVTAINRLERTTVASHPAVIEDVDRRNGGRDVRLHVLADKKLYQVIWVLRDKKDFAKWQQEIESTRQSVAVRP